MEMAERSRSWRVFAPDTHRQDQHLRVTWHREIGEFVISHWRNGICVATTRLDPESAARVIGLLAEGLADAASTPPPTSQAPPDEPHSGRVRDQLSRWLPGNRRPDPSRLAPVTPLRNDDTGVSGTPSPGEQ